MGSMRNIITARSHRPVGSPRAKLAQKTCRLLCDRRLRSPGYRRLSVTRAQSGFSAPSLSTRKSTLPRRSSEWSFFELLHGSAIVWHEYLWVICSWRKQRPSLTSPRAVMTLVNTIAKARASKRKPSGTPTTCISMLSCATITAPPGTRLRNCSADIASSNDPGTRRSRRSRMGLGPGRVRASQ